MLAVKSHDLRPIPETYMAEGERTYFPKLSTDLPMQNRVLTDVYMCAQTHTNTNTSFSTLIVIDSTHLKWHKTHGLWFSNTLVWLLYASVDA